MSEAPFSGAERRGGITVADLFAETTNLIREVSSLRAIVAENVELQRRLALMEAGLFVVAHDATVAKQEAALAAPKQIVDDLREALSRRWKIVGVGLAFLAFGTVLNLVLATRAVGYCYITRADRDVAGCHILPDYQHFRNAEQVREQEARRVAELLAEVPVDQARIDQELTQMETRIDQDRVRLTQLETQIKRRANAH